MIISVKCLKMLSGFPLDFPNSLKNITNQKSDFSTGIFIRNITCESNIEVSRISNTKTTGSILSFIDEYEDVAMNEITTSTERTFICKRKNYLSSEFKELEPEDENKRQKHVKFSKEPPIEFMALPDSEYDRSCLKIVNRKDYYTVWKKMKETRINS